jgi:hypothetical protein
MGMMRTAKQLGKAGGSNAMTLLQKTFLAAGEMTFLGAGVRTVPSCRF